MWHCVTKLFQLCVLYYERATEHFWHGNTNQKEKWKFLDVLTGRPIGPLSPLKPFSPCNKQFNESCVILRYENIFLIFFLFLNFSVITLCIAILGMKYLVYEKVWSFNWVYLVKWAYSQQNQKHSVSGYDFHGLMVLHNIFTLTRSPFRPSCPLSPGGPGWPIGPMSIAQIRTQIQLNCNIHRHIYMMKNSQNSTMMMINKWTQRAFIIWTYLEVRLAVQQSSWIWKRINNLVS